MQLLALFGINQVVLINLIDLIEVFGRQLEPLQNGCRWIFEVMDAHVQEQLTIAQLVLQVILRHY